MTGNFHWQGSKGVAHGLHNLQYCSGCTQTVADWRSCSCCKCNDARSVKRVTTTAARAVHMPVRDGQKRHCPRTLEAARSRARHTGHGILSRHHAGTALASSRRDVLLAERIVLDAEEARKLSTVDLRAVDIVDFLHFCRIEA